MWILPKNLPLSNGALDTAAFISDSNEQSQICASSLMVRSNPSPARTWSQKWKRDSWTQHLSGRILKPSHATNFATEWASLWPVILVSHFPQPESDLEQKTLATSGPTSPEQFELFDLNSVSSKMSKDTSASDSERSLESWNKLVTQRRGEYSARVKSALRTSGSGSSSWPSPVASEVRQGFQDRSRGMKGSQESLTTVVVKDAANWSTPESHPRTHTPRNVGAGTYRGKEPLANQVAELHGLPAPANHSTDGSRQESWLTPRANEPDSDSNFVTRNADRGEHCHPSLSQQAKSQCSTATVSTGAHRQRDGSMIPKLDSQVGGKLNPRWVETLMGLPVGWTMPSCASPVTIALTSYASSATESCQQQQNELFES